MQIPRFGVAASLGMTKQVWWIAIRRPALAKRAQRPFRSVEWQRLDWHRREIPVSGDGPQSSRAERTEATPL